MLTFVAAILVFSAIVLVHEFGHYKVAKMVGIKVEEFAIGMGPVLYKREKNGTLYSIRAIPIGGFVRMEGEDEEVKSPTSFTSKTVWQRFAVIAAGPLMNYFLAMVLFMAIAFSLGVSGNTVEYVDQTSKEYAVGLRTGDEIVSINGKKAYIWEDIAYELELSNKDSDTYKIEVKRDGQIKEFDIGYTYRNIVGITPVMVDGNTTTTVSPSDVNAPAYKAGIKDKDIVTKINDVPISTWEELTLQINSSDSLAVKVTVDRKGEELSFDIVPEEQLTVKFNTAVEKSFTKAIVSSVYKTGYYIKLMFEFIGMLLAGEVGSEAVGGPVSVVSMVGEAAKMGLYSLLNFAAFISINLGFMNLLPIPALDGSKLVFLLIEKVRGKAISAEKEGFVHFIGFVLLISLMVFVTYNDILRLFRL